MPRPACKVKQGLFESCSEAAAALSEVGKRIASGSTTDAHGTCDVLWEECEAARERCIQVRREIAEHAQTHGCGAVFGVVSCFFGRVSVFRRAQVAKRSLMVSFLAVCRIATGQPQISPHGIVNAASLMAPGLSGGSIAQGSLFSIYGSKLGPSSAIPTLAYPLSTTLNGVSVQVIQGTTTVNAIPFYVEPHGRSTSLSWRSNAPLGLKRFDPGYQWGDQGAGLAGDGGRHQCGNPRGERRRVRTGCYAGFHQRTGTGQHRNSPGGAGSDHHSLCHRPRADLRGGQRSRRSRATRWSAPAEGVRRQECPRYGLVST